MVIHMNDSKLTTLEQIRDFLAGTLEVAFTPMATDAARYEAITQVLCRFGYGRLKRADKGMLLRYLAHTSGYSRQQLTRLVRQYLDSGRLVQRYKPPVAGFARKYSEQDVRLLAEMDTLHDTLSGPATKCLLERAYRVHGDDRYATLAGISVAHLYNLRAKPAYQARRTHWSKTRPATVPFGVRRPPRPDGQPGFIRIDTVHQGDQDGIKGLYHLNAVDCVTQWEVVASCERIGEAFLLPVLECLFEQFPFEIRGFHADNGGEYVNRHVAKMLNKLKLEFTRSRPRRSNDNALAETKNGAIVRKHFGYAHIPQRFASQVNAFCGEYLNPYINFHRPSFFALETIDAKGKIRKRYPQENLMTPFDKLRSLPQVAQTLKPDITLQSLQTTALSMTDNQAAQRLNDARIKLFRSFHYRPKSAA